MNVKSYHRTEHLRRVKMTDYIADESDHIESDLLDIFQEFCQEFTFVTSNETPDVPGKVDVSTIVCEEIGLTLSDSQHRLIYLYHALQCEDSNASPPRPCRLTRKCLESVKLLGHVSSCSNGMNCPVVDCFKTFRLMEHSRGCSGHLTCGLCLPLNETKRRKQSRLSVIINKRPFTNSAVLSPTSITAGTTSQRPQQTVPSCSSIPNQMKQSTSDQYSETTVPPSSLPYDYGYPQEMACPSQEYYAQIPSIDAYSQNHNYLSGYPYSVPHTQEMFQSGPQFKQANGFISASNSQLTSYYNNYYTSF